MKIGDLIRIRKIGLDPHEPYWDMPGYLLYVLEVAKTGVSIMVFSGRQFGHEYFLPYDNRDFELISSLN